MYAQKEKGCGQFHSLFQLMYNHRTLHVHATIDLYDLSANVA